MSDNYQGQNPTPDQPPAPPTYSAPAAPAPQSYPAAAPYPQAEGGYPNAPYGAYPPSPKTNTLAIVSLVAGIAGLVVLPFIGSIVAVITGHMSLSQLKKQPEGGRGMAIAGLITGYIGLVLAVLGIIIIVATFAFIAANPNLYIS